MVIVFTDTLSVEAISQGILQSLRSFRMTVCFMVEIVHLNHVDRVLVSSAEIVCMLFNDEK